MWRDPQKNMLFGILAILLLSPSIGLAQKPFERIVVFGDSLSDPGNEFYLSGRHLNPPYDTLDALLIPDAPYAIGGNHFSNGATWVELLAKEMDLKDSVKPAFMGVNKGTLKSTNYAVGGARAYENGINVNLTAQLNAFFVDAKGVASEDALYVIALGGNDVRDAVSALSIDPTGSASNEIIGRALMTISDSIFALYHSGARRFMIANSPDLSLTPAIQSLDLFSPGASFAAAQTSSQFNMELDKLLDTLSVAFPDLEIVRLNFYQGLHDIVAQPDQYGLINVQNACVMPNQPPFTCEKQDRYLFWDGIHPTKVVHRILAGIAAEILTQAQKENSNLESDYYTASDTDWTSADPIEVVKSGNPGNSKLENYADHEIGDPTIGLVGTGTVRTITGPIVVPPGVVYDGKGETLTAEGMGDGSQDEEQQPLFILLPGASVKNVTIAAPGCEGVHMMGDNTLENIVWEDVGEDAASIRSYFPGGTIHINGGSVNAASDVVFQLNSPSKIIIKNLTATNISKLVRQNKDTPIQVVLDGVTASDVKTALVMCNNSDCTLMYRDVSGTPLTEGPVQVIDWEEEASN